MDPDWSTEEIASLNIELEDLYPIEGLSWTKVKEILKVDLKSHILADLEREWQQESPDFLLQHIYQCQLVEPGLDALYRRIMDQIRGSDDAELCKRILAVVSAVYRPITLDELTSLVDMPDGVSGDESLTEIIGLCGSFLTLQNRTISFVHQSAKDFLLTEASNDIFPSTIQGVHYTIFSRSLQVMSRTLRRDIYWLRAPGISIDQVNQPDPDPLAAARYSCLYWVNHLLDCHTREDTIKDLKDGGSVYSFLRQSFLYWLEALSLLKSVSNGVVMIKKLELLQVRFSILSRHVIRNTD
jgi:hypothetical protein